MTAGSAFLHALEVAADHADVAEKQFRQEAAQRLAALEQARAFAFRRLNFLRAIVGAVTAAADEEEAVGAALAVLREKLGWASESEARAEVEAHFSPVAEALWRSRAAPETPPVPTPDDALADFESWYADERRAPFWLLFEQVMPETPLVDF